MSDIDQLLKIILNVSKYHREHEKFYAQNPLQQAKNLQFLSNTLKTMADRWSQLETGEAKKMNPYTGCEDLNEISTIAYIGVLFMEGEGEPQEITRMKADIRRISDENSCTGKWLTKAMEESWDVGKPLIQNPLLADVLGERHRVIINDWQSALLSSLIAVLCERAGDILDHIEFTSVKIREDLKNTRSYPDYLYSAAELLDRAADLASESAILVHDNERRWRVFHKRIDEVAKHMSRPVDPAKQ